VKSLRDAVRITNSTKTIGPENLASYFYDLVWVAMQTFNTYIPIDKQLICLDFSPSAQDHLVPQSIESLPAR
jgi:hypothetical protein